MLFYISLANAGSGNWIGAVIVNREQATLAGRAAVELYAQSLAEKECVFAGEVQAAIRPLPVGSCVPADFIGRLLSQAELLTIGELRHMRSDGEGNLRNADDAPPVAVH